MARNALPLRLALKSFFGSFSRAPLRNVSLTAFLSVPTVQIIPLWDQTGTPFGLVGFFHFTSSRAAGSAFLIMARSRETVSPFQSPGSFVPGLIVPEEDSPSQKGPVTGAF